MSTPNVTHTGRDAGFTVSHSSFHSHFSLNPLTSAWGCCAQRGCYGDGVTLTTVVASECGVTQVGTEMRYDRQRSPKLLLLLLLECTTTQKDENSHALQASVATPLLDLNEMILSSPNTHAETRTRTSRHRGKSMY